MTSILLTFFVSLLAVVAQIFSSVPEAKIPLTLFSSSSSQQDVTTQLSAPVTLTVARSGNIYVFDDGNSRIVKLNSSGKFIAEFGGPESGPGSIQRGGLGASIAVAKDETVYVGDPIKPRVQIFDSKGAFIQSFRVPFPVTSIAVNSKREIYVAGKRKPAQSATAGVFRIGKVSAAIRRTASDNSWSTRTISEPGRHRVRCTR